MAQPQQPNLDAFVGRIADLVVAAILSRLEAALTGLPAIVNGTLVNGHSGQAAARTRSAPTRKMDMSCRWAGCTNPSKGPRFGYFCEKHISEPAAARKKAAEQYRKEHSRAA